MNFLDAGFFRIGVCTPELRLAHCDFNSQEIIKQIRIASDQGVLLLTFPELCITGYTIADLFYDNLLLESVESAITSILPHTLGIVAVIGAPIRFQSHLFNCAVVICEGKIVGIVPKTYIPNSGEFYEQRWFSSAKVLHNNQTLTFCNQKVPFGTKQLFEIYPIGFTFGIELCEDLWAVSPPSLEACLAGAEVIVNLSASNETLGKADYRRSLVTSQSARAICAYAYASSGPNESSTDLVFSGHSLIAENGVLLKETTRFQFSSQLVFNDIDIEKIRTERTLNSSFSQNDIFSLFDIQKIFLSIDTISKFTFERTISKTPFVPSSVSERNNVCNEILQLQSTALQTRIRHLNNAPIVIGLSGGLDSTLALLVAIDAFQKQNIPLLKIHAISMPGFGTTTRTKTNAQLLAEAFGVTFKEIPIHKAVEQHLQDLDHSLNDYSITYENAQARERTQILMNLANSIGGIVLGTGDLSELALGWCTYNADHMSMYGVNAGVPKTLVRYCINWFAINQNEPIKTILDDIADTPISPELLPPSGDGTIAQKTEEVVGPYILHDFFLYYMMRQKKKPEVIFFLAKIAFETMFSPKEILHWLEIFYKRFFSQQFKRSCLPDSPKIGSVSVSPRGDLRMPSDATVQQWLENIKKIVIS